VNFQGYGAFIIIYVQVEVAAAKSQLSRLLCVYRKSTNFCEIFLLMSNIEICSGRNKKYKTFIARNWMTRDSQRIPFGRPGLPKFLRGLLTRGQQRFYSGEGEEILPK
jgi:hypothetical protein